MGAGEDGASKLWKDTLTEAADKERSVIVVCSWEKDVLEVKEDAAFITSLNSFTSLT